MSGLDSRMLKYSEIADLIKNKRHQVVPSFGPRYLFEVKQPELLEALLEEGIEGLQLELENGWTLLHECSSKGIVTTKIVELLGHQVNSRGSIQLNLNRLFNRVYSTTGCPTLI